MISIKFKHRCFKALLIDTINLQLYKFNLFRTLNWSLSFNKYIYIYIYIYIYTSSKLEYEIYKTWYVGFMHSHQLVLINALLFMRSRTKITCITHIRACIFLNIVCWFECQSGSGKTDCFDLSGF